MASFLELLIIMMMIKAFIILLTREKNIKSKAKKIVSLKKDPAYVPRSSNFFLHDDRDEDSQLLVSTQNEKKGTKDTRQSKGFSGRYTFN